ncbi:MAG: hypothetical protein KBD24_04210 [Candidatus Pacebacteria bacterium]|nr:hypothetical protein [Candidatus Paceibacterota bacterium]
MSCFGIFGIHAYFVWTPARNSRVFGTACYNPANRVLKQVTIDDAAEANHVFDTLMGTDVAARKSFIQTNAKMAELDI